ncbi:MAG: prefoldin subunit [archaeon]|nr:prefoldin subunit [archaeon]
MNQRQIAEAMMKDLQKFQKDLEIAELNRRKLAVYLRETHFVKREFDLLVDPKSTSTATIYKKVGPILVPESNKSAHKTVSNRVELLQRQIADQEAIITDLEDKIMNLRKVFQSTNQ